MPDPFEPPPAPREGSRLRRWLARRAPRADPDEPELGYESALPWMQPDELPADEAVPPA